MTTLRNNKKEQKAEAKTRPPVVVVLGHVDHGKSSLLEAIRQEFRITARESGGITQHIGAYVAEYEGKHITFLDTPGHEAFSAMRSRGAEVADIGILVVAGDEGVKPQTKESIAQAQAAGLPLVVSITKTDKPGTDIVKVKNELAKEGVIVESMGGQVPCVETSAQSKMGIKELLEMVILVSELQDLGLHEDKGTTGHVIEVSRDAQRGIQATLLLKEGTLRLGNVVGTPSGVGKLKMLEDFAGNPIEEAGPSVPVLAVGFESSPFIGEEFRVFPSVEEARAHMKESSFAPLQVAEAEEGMMQLIVKADVAGSLEAISQIVDSVNNEGKFKIVKADVGDVTEGDVKFARDTKARILAFRVKIPAVIARVAEREKISLERFDVIYDIAEYLHKIIEGGREPAAQELGMLRVLATFSTERDRQVIGGRVVAGIAKKGAEFEIMREEQSVGKGRVVNLQRNKKDMPTVSKGEEAGLMVQTDTAIQTGDHLKFFTS
ncbi:MAG: GTP-binding protein [bacterium]|nr:GTP-binding protein [bacterium]